LVLIIVIFIAVLFFALSGWLFYQNRQSPLPRLTPDPTTNQEIVPKITTQELNQEWYWASASQKKPGTPVNWVFTEAGRSSCWHQAGSSCEFTP